MIKIISNSAQETMSVGHKLAKCLPNGITITFNGDLGAGKTTLVRGIAEGLNIKDVVQSPTFNIMKIYLKGDRPLIHIDAYRLNDCSIDIGLDEYIGYETGITVIEWPMFIEKLIPTFHIEITINRLNDSQREILINGDEEILGAIKL